MPLLPPRQLMSTAKTVGWVEQAKRPLHQRARRNAPPLKSRSAGPPAEPPISLFEKFFLKGEQRIENGTVFRDHHVLLQPNGLLQAGLPAVGFEGHIHVRLVLGGIFEGEAPRYPHPLVKG